MLKCVDDYIDPSSGDVVGGLVAISNGESDKMAKSRTQPALRSSITMKL